MKKLFLLTFALFVAVTVSAQRSIKLSIPKYNVLFKVKADGLNMRKAPDANSAKLMAWYSDAGSYETEVHYFFSDENRGRYKADNYTGAFIEAVHPSKDELLPITGESGDWYQVECTNNGKVFKAYVMKKFGTKMDVADWGAVNFCPSINEYDEQGNLLSMQRQPVVHRPGGKYKSLDFAVTIYGSYSEDDEFSAYMHVPFLLDGKYLAVETFPFTVIPTAGISAPQQYWQIEYGMDDEVSYAMKVKMGKCPKSRQRQAVTEWLLNMPEAHFEQILDSMLFNRPDDVPSLVFIRSTAGTYENIILDYGVSSFPKHSQTFSFMAQKTVSTGSTTGKRPQVTGTKQSRTTSATAQDNTVYDIVDQMPQFPGGSAGIVKYLQENIKYPAKARESGVRGRVLTSFVVDADGSITDVKVVKSVDKALDAEAVRVIKGMPRWTPGKKNGTPVRVKYSIPINFNL